MEDLSVGYDPAAPLLRGLNLSLCAGSRTVTLHFVTGITVAERTDEIPCVVARFVPFGMFVDIGDESAGLGRVQELRQAIAHFRGKGKFAIGFAESLGSGGTHFSDYYLASALEQIWLQPSGNFAVAGLAIETPFIKDGLDRLGSLGLAVAALSMNLVEGFVPIAAVSFVLAAMQVAGGPNLDAIALAHLKG